MKITIVIDAPHYIGGIRYIERFLKILSLTGKEVELNLIYVNCKSSLNVSAAKTEKFIKIPNQLYRLDRLFARFTGISFFSLYLIRYAKNSNIFFSDVFLPKSLKKRFGIKLIHWFPDFQVYDLEHLFPKDKIISRKLYIKLQLRTCDYLLTQSNTDMQRMKSLFPAFADKIIKWSFAEPVSEIPEVENMEVSGFSLRRGEYLLYPHQGWAHKNHLLLFRTLQNIKGQTLVLTGRLSDPRNEKYSQDLMDAIHENEANILNLGLVNSKELDLLMKNAKAILNFSSYEGWSSCVEEGVMMGVPLILSAIPIHKEQISNALFVDISSVESATETFKKALDKLDSFNGYNYNLRIKESVQGLTQILENL